MAFVPQGKYLDETGTSNAGFRWQGDGAVQKMPQHGRLAAYEAAENKNSYFTYY
jgi:hypothetical protein